MARRPRPQTRPPPQKAGPKPKRSSLPKPSTKPRSAKITEAELASDFESGNGDESQDDSEDSDVSSESEGGMNHDHDVSNAIGSGSGADEGSENFSHDEEDEDDVDVDAPRVAQWVDEDELEEEVEDEEEEQEEEIAAAGPSDAHNVESPSELKSLQDDLSNLPLGALRKAQRALAQANVDSDSDDDDEADSNDEPEEEQAGGPSLKGKEKEKPEWSIKPRPDIARRSNKNAPIEVTSKRPVTRRRTVVEVKTVQPRDPRFLPLAGEFRPDKFQQNYGFLADAHSTELRTLRENLKRARKLLASSPRDTQYEREQEVNRLELAVKRAESLVNRDRREKVEQEALAKVTQEEKDKRKHGKGGWWMKDSDKKDLLVRARYDALAAAGGKRAVKKAIEKKQKKIGQKEKKSRPFARGQGGGDERPRKRSFDGEEGGRSDKRRRV